MTVAWFYLRLKARKPVIKAIGNRISRKVPKVVTEHEERNSGADAFICRKDNGPCLGYPIPFYLNHPN
jgi:hypothetical protein